MITIDLKDICVHAEAKRLKEVCFECSVCAPHCVVQLVAGFDRRNTFVYDVFRSADPAAHSALWSCSSCHKCVEVCPQDADPLSVIVGLREKAFTEGRAPSYVYDLVGLVLATGYAFPVTKKALKEREALGMSALDSTAAEELRCIAERTGLLEKLKGE